MACVARRRVRLRIREREGNPCRHRSEARAGRCGHQKCRRNRIFSAHDRRIASPLVAGYIETMKATIRLQREPFDAAVEAADLVHGHSDVGALVTFTGICRGDEDGVPIAALTLEHYPGMGESEIERHVAEAGERWPLLGV